MAILDGLPSTEAEMKNALELAAKVLELSEPKLRLTPKQKSVIELVKQGLSLADILEITKEERDAMFVQGCRFIQVGEPRKARDVLSLLYQLEPLDARVIYMLAVTYQLEGDIPRAAKLYVQFLALDATNAEGYVRLGECHMAAKENDTAADCFRTAIGECARGNGTAATRERAAQLLEHVKKSAS